MPAPLSHVRARTLRRNQTNVERILWTALRSRQTEFKFRRQHPIPPYTADFACVEARLVVELDGGQHGRTRDAVRDATLARMAWRVVRYWNSDVIEKQDGVLADIVAACRARIKG
jgi:primosomal protein N' (replication factor Y)